ncbi:YebC/PmpR family DNA-binding transcriptional regulator [Candidatus Vampirococcus lugosii]|uniref:Probable transcriptional regulatory protein VAMP_22n171 n=1 Tax=Candidatus Vampirococcus lugosii TaxID=2789015 RepID=A0ABS5QKH3_9BACT|nr:YebC/PmpR family DNA-binding transcriptional regulator [Candidatus Vampirococcus lugosii]MBS8121738.1 transcriptional regulator [Candidatus Vampirococcus lugosii]
MAGHSKWHNIKHKKAAQDSKKAKVYTKIGKIIQMSAKLGADPNLNPSLASALDKAKYYNLPKDVIQRAITKGSGQNNNENLEEVFYEGYGPSGIAILIKTITENKNRSSGEIRSIITKFGGSMGEPGSVSWQFLEKSFFLISGKIEILNDKGKEIEKINKVNFSQIEEDAIISGAEDIISLENEYKIIGDKTDFLKIKNYLKENKYKIEDNGIEYIPQNTIDLDEKGIEKLYRLIDELEDNDDVDQVYHNLNG